MATIAISHIFSQETTETTVLHAEARGSELTNVICFSVPVSHCLAFYLKDTLFTAAYIAEI